MRHRRRNPLQMSLCTYSALIISRGLLSFSIQEIRAGTDMQIPGGVRRIADRDTAMEVTNIRVVFRQLLPAQIGQTHFSGHSHEFRASP